MSYVKQDWEKGDVITHDKLNHMEDGIDSAMHLIDNITFYINEDGDLIYEYNESQSSDS